MRPHDPSDVPLSFFTSRAAPRRVFQDYYNSNRLTQEGDSLVALIGAIQLFSLYGFSPLVGKIFDAFGIQVLMPLGSFLIVLATFMLSICKPDQTYQYFLSQVRTSLGF